MGNRNLVLTIIAEQPYIHSIKEEALTSENTILFSAISETYLPMLNLFGRLEAEGIPFKINLILSPILCTLLDNPVVQKQYLDFLEAKIALGEKETKRLSRNKELLCQAEDCLNKARKDKQDFEEVYNQNLLAAFRKFAAKGYLELTATAATGAFLPHYVNLTEALNAQIETGLYAQRHFFGETGEGFYLPFLGWAKGLEWNLRSYGVNYTIVDARSFLFTEKPASTGIFRPQRTLNSLVLFAADPDTPGDILGEDGYAENPVYRSQLHDIGFDLDAEGLDSFLTKDSVRIETGYRYYTKDSDDLEFSDDLQIYDRQKAVEQAKKDALDFYQKKAEKLMAADAILEKTDSPEGIDDNSPVLVCRIPADILGQTWHEGLDFLEELIRLVAEKDQIRLSLCKELISDQFKLPKINPYPCAASGTGYGEDLVEAGNSWMLRYIRKATERMIDLTDRFPSETGLKGRLLNLGAKEVLLAQCCDWPKMVSSNRLPDKASAMFKKNIISFTTVFDSLASNTVSTEWLTSLEKEHSIFPWINYRIFSRKK